MKLSAPKQLTFWIAVAVEAIGVIMKIARADVNLAGAGLSGILMLIGFIVLAVACLVEGL